jgi:outer membrane lipoprotein SlyB
LEEVNMKHLTVLTLAGVAATVLLASPLAARAEDSQPQPKGGTAKGAVVGGVAGHMMGGHTKTGAAVGAVAGHHEKSKSEDRIKSGEKP